MNRTFTAAGATIGEASAWVEAQCATAGLDGETGALLAMVTEEVVSNIVKYGGPPPPAIELCLARDGAVVELHVRDDGIAFDPTAAPIKQLSDDAALREVGGLGIAIVRAMMDELVYARERDWNCLTLRKRLG